MQLTAREKDELPIAIAAVVTRQRLERGVKLNHPEAVALMSDLAYGGARIVQGFRGRVGRPLGG